MQDLSIHSLLTFTKSFKRDSTSNSSEYPFRAYYGRQIKPIPVLYKKIGQNYQERVDKVNVKGYKYLSRVMASGQYTSNILKKVKQSSCIKLIRHLDFDPYLCDTSELGSLSEILKKQRRGLYNLALVFRRFTTKNELQRFSLFLARVKNVSKIKIEFPNPQRIELQNVQNLTRSLEQLPSLRSTDIRINGSKDIFKNVQIFRRFSYSSQKLQEVRFYVNFGHVEPLSVEEFKLNRKGFYKNLKSIDIKLASKSGWASYFDGDEAKCDYHRFFCSLPNYANPVNLSFRFDKSHMSANILKEIARMLPLLTNLRYFFMEFESVKFTEFEMMVLAKVLVECKQLERVTFKYLDNSMVSIMNILQFIVIIAKYSNLTKFDLYFRKIFYPEWQAPETIRKLDDLENVKYMLTKKSIHIWRQ